MPTASDVDSASSEPWPMQLPECIRTLSSATPAAAAKRQKQVVLTAADHLVLMQLCTEHRPDY